MQKTKMHAKPAVRANAKTQRQPKSAASVPATKTASPPKARAATKAPPKAELSPPLPRSSKQATIQHLLRRKEGAGIAELMTVTGWQSHSVRAALSSLRKQGVILTRTAGAEGGTVYRIADSPTTKTAS